MFKVLLKKQIQELLSSLLRTGKKKGTSRRNAVLYGLLFVYVAAMFGVFCYMSFSSLCVPLYEAGLRWLFFAIAGITAFCFGVFGSVFSSYTALYDAKDNDFLLSLPIPPSRILLARMGGLFLLNFFFEGIVWIPAAIVWAVNGYMTASSAFSCVCILFLLPFLTLAVSCVFGWFVALGAKRVRNKSLISLIASLLFLCVYFYAYANLQKGIAAILANPGRVADGIHRYLWLFWRMGSAATGNLRSLLFFAGICAVLFGLVFWVLNATFLKTAISRNSGKKAVYRERFRKASSPSAALLRREVARFWSSPIYFLNCGLGSVLLLVGAVAVGIKGAALRELLNQIPGMGAYVGAIAALALCMICSMITVTAPSVSLEGNSFWIVRSLPVPAKSVLRAKIQLHLLVSVPPALLCSLALCAALHLNVLNWIGLFLISVAFPLFCACFGLMMNLRFPNFEWTNEAVPVKQGISVLLSIFVPWTFLLLAGAGLAPLCMSGILPCGACLILFGILSALFGGGMLVWLDRRGTARFSSL